MLLKRVMASTLIGVMMLGLTQTAFASELTAGTEDITGNETELEIKSIEEQSESEINIIGVPDLGVQLNDLYHDVGRQLNIDYIYVKILHLLAGGKAIYADKRPNIYSELTVDSVGAPFDIEGANQSYALQAPWVICPDEEIQRPNKHYIPDAAYSTTSEVIKIMNKRYFADRGSMQTYFDALSNAVRTNIIFCEAVMAYTNAPQEAIESFYPTYEKILYEKDKNENVVQSNKDGTFEIKDKFKQIFISNNISDEHTLDVLALVLSFDSKLAECSDPDAIKDTYVTPYIKNYTSRENMMLAAMSVVGKVRYVWGGGHVSSGKIDGINPSWQAFYNAYPTNESETGYGMCIKPTKSWCPIHGIVENENGCLMMAETVYSAEDYVDSRKEIEQIDTQNMEGEKYDQLLESSVDFSHGMNSHRLDGLDCSGYASWLYNQISDRRTYDSGATAFISAGGLSSVSYGSRMLPGDVFTWGDHIVVVIGPARIDSEAYVMVESSPNMVKFGVLYYSSASQSDINTAITVAREANDLIGNLPNTEKTHIYNMDSVGYKTDEETGEVSRYAEIGRLNYSYKDENIVISEYNKKIKDMNAQEIIQYTIDNYTEQYISGLKRYTGSVFNVDRFKTNEIDGQIIETNKTAIDSAVSSENKSKVEVLADWEAK